MKKLLIIIIFASLQLKGGVFSFYQSQAILGEPVILEKNKDWFGTIFIDGPEINCIELKDFYDEERINLVDYFKMEGEYEIKIIPDSLICEMEKDLKKDEEELRFIEDEKEYEILKLKIEDERENIDKLKKKESLYEIKANFKIKINYPIDFDKYIYENYLKFKENLKDFFGYGYHKNTEGVNKLMEEISKHPESNYFPWAIYIQLYRGLYYLPDIRNYAGILKIEKRMPKLDTSSANFKILKDTIAKIEKIENEKKDFFFLYELILQKGIILFYLGENDLKLKEIFENVSLNARYKNTKEIANLFLKLLNPNSYHQSK